MTRLLHKLHLISLFSLFFATVSSAQLKPSPDSKWNQKVIERFQHLTLYRTPVCEVTSDAKSYLFLFDGLNGYCPLSAAFYSNLTPKTKSPSEHYKNIEDVSKDLGNYAWLFEQELKLETGVSAKALHPKLEVVYERNCRLVIDLIQHYSAEIEAAQIQIFYYSKDDEYIAASCAKKIHQQTQARIRTLGYSLGGHSAIRFARTLETHLPNIAVDGFLIDPVAKGLESIKGAITHEHSRALDVSKRRGKWIDIYQRQDTECPVEGLYGIHGTEVPGATCYEIKAEDFKAESSSSARGHVNIHGMDLTRKLVRKFLAH